MVLERQIYDIGRSNDKSKPISYRKKQQIAAIRELSEAKKIIASDARKMDMFFYQTRQMSVL
jgi:hypothetical protein